MTTIKEDLRPVTIDGNEACARVAYRLNEVCSIFPITPATPMAEIADQWSSEGRKNIWGTIPTVIEMQSELGAAGTLHGSVLSGSLATSFTSSQGLLLMIPNMYKIAGELTPCVIHVASRALAVHALSIFADHQDVMAVRQTGFGILASSNVQEAQDFAAIVHAATLEARVPFVHFFDGFRTSHEVVKIDPIEDEQLRQLVNPDLILAHRARAMNPDNPELHGTIQNPDVYFQGREASNRYYNACPGIVQKTMDRFAKLTGREYTLFEYVGHPEAERLIVIMASGAEAVRETVEAMVDKDDRVGFIKVNLFRPFDIRSFICDIPTTVQKVAVLDRCKEPGSTGEPLYLDVVAAFSESRDSHPMPTIVGGRYGIGGKELHPGMIAAAFDELNKDHPKPHFTLGIDDDVSHISLPFDRDFSVEPDNVHRAIFYGLGSDGTVSANKNTIKIIGEDTPLYAQAYFVYDSKKSGSQTVSHLRFGPSPIRSTYLIRSAQFVGCHHFGFVRRMDVLQFASCGATLLLNSPFGAGSVWDHLPRSMQENIIEKRIRLFVIDATDVARKSGLRSRTNTILQTCFFAISGVLPRDKAIEHIKRSIEASYGKKGDEVVRENFAAVDMALANLHEVSIPRKPSTHLTMLRTVSDQAPEFVQSLIAPVIRGEADCLPVSLMPADGTFPSGTSKWEKRNVADFVPVWDPDLCIQCGNCSLVCPHACIRTRLFDATLLAEAPPGFKSNPIDAMGFPETRYTLQIYQEDCTGCALCTQACPVRNKSNSRLKAINMVPKVQALFSAVSGDHEMGLQSPTSEFGVPEASPSIEQQNRKHLAFFETLPVNDRAQVDFATVRGAQFLEPLFEFSGACAGCGETPYLKLASQLFGDRMLIANASGCSSVYGGSLPTVPWTISHEGSGPAWATSLFEDNAEFGLGMRLSADRHMNLARAILRELKREVGEDLVYVLIHAPQRTESQIRQQRERVAKLKEILTSLHGDKSRELLSVADHLVRRSVWIVGGDGWAYDIGSAGVDHVLASGKDVNLLVLDNEVYANTGGQASKASPLGAVAKFANAGKKSAKKDLALQAIAYGDVYVARVALGANPQQTLTAFREAEAYPGPSLIVAYSHCIAHGINMEKGLEQQSLAVHCGAWPLIRFDPELIGTSQNPLLLDSKRPTIHLEEYTENELRFRMLRHTNPLQADRITHAANEALSRHWALYEKMAAD